MKEYYFGNKDKIYYRKNKFMKRPTIVFIHGLSGSSSAWLPYEKKFEKRYNVLSLDLRGHGKSFRPLTLKDYKIQSFSNDVYKIMKKEKITKPIMVSHSFGNLIALDLVKKHQNKIKALVLVNADAAPGERKIAKTIVPLLKIAALLKYTSFPKKGNHIDYQKYIGTGDWNIKRLSADIANTGIRSYLFSTYHAYAFNIKKFLSHIKIPVLIIHGDKDTIFPIDAGREIHKSIKNSKFITFRGANHIIILNNESRLAKTINTFVNKVS